MVDDHLYRPFARLGRVRARPALLPVHEPEDFGHDSPEVGEDQADAVAATAEHGVEGVAEGALERSAGEAAVGLRVADHRLDGAAPSEIAPERRGHAAALIDPDCFCPACARSIACRIIRV